MRLRFFFFFGILFSSIAVFAQSEINKMDTEGKRHGVWKKMYPDGQQLRYEGQFEHGKEVGTFKFYCEDCKEIPTAIKEFTAASTTTKVKYFTAKGKLVSEGDMDGRNRIGEWIYYHKKGSNIMTRESYVAGALHGTKITYYPNGTITEELTYVNGSMEGVNNYYSQEGKLLKKLAYAKNKLEGKAVYYDARGQVSIEGQYKNDKKHGLWKYYKNGTIDREETFPKPLKKI